MGIVRVLLTGLFAAAVIPFVKEMAWAVAVEASLDQLFRHFGWDHAKVMTWLAPYVIVALGGYLLLSAGLRIERSARPKKSVTDIDPRLAFENILKSKKWRMANGNKADSNWWADVKVARHQLGSQFHDALAAGVLEARGRKQGKGGKSGPEDWIPKEDWHRIEIAFDGNYPRFRPVAVRRDGTGVEYIDVRLSAQQLAKYFKMRRRCLLATD